MTQGVKKKHGSLPLLGLTGETSETLLCPPSGELLRSIEARCERRLRHLGRDLRIALKLAGVVSHHLSSTMVILSGYRWPPLLLSNSVFSVQNVNIGILKESPFFPTRNTLLVNVLIGQFLFCLFLLHQTHHSILA